MDDVYFEAVRADPKPRMAPEAVHEEKASKEYVYINKSYAETVLFDGARYAGNETEGFGTYAKFVGEALESSRKTLRRGERALVRRDAIQAVYNIACKLAACQKQIAFKTATQRGYLQSVDYKTDTTWRSMCARSFGKAFDEMKRTASFD